MSWWCWPAFREHSRALAAPLGAVAPARRGELYDRAMVEADTAVLVPAAEIMQVLPAAVRIREVTRVLGLAKIQELEAEVRVWSAYLGWPEASAALEVALRSGDADERAHGYTLLVQAARRSRDRQAVAEVVVRLGRLRNEQDPVRGAALTALATVAPLLTADAAAGLTQLTTDAVDARDASAATTTALSALAADVLQHHVAVPPLREWALLTIDLVSSGAHVPVLRRFDTVLRRGQETMVFERLSGWVEAGIARGRYGPLFALTDAFGKRAWQLPHLQELLRRAIGPQMLPSVARTAIGLWLADPRTRADRVAEVLETDATAAAIHEVWAIICTTRTDLLDRVLDGHPRGRFVEAGVRWVPGWTLHAERWLPRQQARFVDLQELIVADAGRGVWQRAAAIRAAARVPGAGRALVLRHLDAGEVVIAEAALGALVWTDRPDEALPVLLSHAGGEGRYLGGRPPYGYTLQDLGPHPNPGKAADGRHLHGLTPDPTSAPIVQRIFREFLAGYGIFAIAEGLTNDQIPCPSAHDRARNRHRTGIAWSKSAIRVILTNPRYTGHQVWNKQRTDEILLDVDDVAMGHTTIVRWNDTQKWITSKDPSHEPLIDSVTFAETQQILSRRGHGPGGEHKRRRTRNPYVFRGLIHCAACNRRMQGQYSHGDAYYRCRFPQEYAIANKIDHPSNVYLREDAVVDPIDTWLATAFAPHHIDATITAMTDAQPDDHTAAIVGRTRQTIKDCDTKLAGYRAALDAGADPTLVTTWIAETQAHRSRAEAELHTTIEDKPHRMSRTEIAHLVASLGDALTVLRHADPIDKAEVYRQLGLRLDYTPETETVRAEINLNTHRGVLVCDRGGT